MGEGGVWRVMTQPVSYLLFCFFLHDILQHWVVSSTLCFFLFFSFSFFSLIQLTTLTFSGQYTSWLAGKLSPEVANPLETPI